MITPQTRREVISTERDGGWREWANYVLIKIQENSDSLEKHSEKTSESISKVLSQISTISEKNIKEIENLKRDEITPLKKEVADIKMQLVKMGVFAGLIFEFVKFALNVIIPYLAK